MDCTQEYIMNCTLIASMNGKAEYLNVSALSDDKEYNEHKKLYEDVRFYCNRILIPVVLFIGIIGNTVTIAMLRKRQLQHSCTKTGKRVTSGLLCLAVSDMAFCVIGFMSAFVPSYSSIIISDGNVWDTVTLYYNSYKGPILNTFLLISTWLIISISVARHDAITEPFHTRGVRRDRIIKLTIFLLSVTINIPQFFQYQTLSHQCQNGCICYYRRPGPMYRLIWYHILWHIVGTILPLLILVYCNCRLLWEIYKNLNGSPHHNHSTSRIAVILVGIITLFLILVCPSMILTFLGEFVKHTDRTLYPFRIAITITNLLQSINFAINFVLYTAVSKEFRRMLVKILQCKNNKKEARLRRHATQHEMQLLWKADYRPLNDVS